MAENCEKSDELTTEGEDFVTGLCDLISEQFLQLDRHLEAMDRRLQILERSAS